MHVEFPSEDKNSSVSTMQVVGWMINPFAESKDIQPLPPEDLKNISDESDFDGPLVDYRAKGNQIELVGKEKLTTKPSTGETDKQKWRCPSYLSMLPHFYS